MKNILIPVDFSASSNHALEYAYYLFGSHGVHYRLLYTSPIPVVSSEMAYMPSEINQIQAGEKMNDALKKTHKRFPDMKLSSTLEYGNLPSAVKNVQKDFLADIIVMGTNGTGGLREFLFGSNTYDVVDNTDLPIVVVPKKADLNPPSRILLNSDFKPVNKKDIYLLLRSILIKHKAKLDILNINGDEEDPDTQKQIAFFEQEFKGLPSSIHLIDSADIVEGIQSQMLALRSDMIVAIKRKKGFLQELITRSVTQKLTFHFEVPMLILHD